MERARDALLVSGDVVRRGMGRKGDPFRYWAEVPMQADEIRSAQQDDQSGQIEISDDDDYPPSAWDQTVQGDSPETRWTAVVTLPAPDAGGDR